MATIEAALYGWCQECGEGSDVGVTRSEAEAWISFHDADNHEDVAE